MQIQVQNPSLSPVRNFTNVPTLPTSGVKNSDVIKPFLKKQQNDPQSQGLKSSRNTNNQPTKGQPSFLKTTIGSQNKLSTKKASNAHHASISPSKLKPSDHPSSLLTSRLRRNSSVHSTHHDPQKILPNSTSQPQLHTNRQHKKKQQIETINEKSSLQGGGGESLKNLELNKHQLYTSRVHNTGTNIKGYLQTSPSEKYLSSTILPKQLLTHRDKSNYKTVTKGNLNHSPTPDTSANVIKPSTHSKQPNYQSRLRNGSLTSDQKAPSNIIQGKRKKSQTIHSSRQHTIDHQRKNLKAPGKSSDKLVNGNKTTKTISQILNTNHNKYNSKAILHTEHPREHYEDLDHSLNNQQVDAQYQMIDDPKYKIMATQNKIELLKINQQATPNSSSQMSQQNNIIDSDEIKIKDPQVVFQNSTEKLPDGFTFNKEKFSEKNKVKEYMLTENDCVVQDNGGLMMGWVDDKGVDVDVRQQQQVQQTEVVVEDGDNKDCFDDLFKEFTKGKSDPKNKYIQPSARKRNTMNKKNALLQKQQMQNKEQSMIQNQQLHTHQLLVKDHISPLTQKTKSHNIGVTIHDTNQLHSNRQYGMQSPSQNNYQHRSGVSPLPEKSLNDILVLLLDLEQTIQDMLSHTDHLFFQDLLASHSKNLPLNSPMTFLDIIETVESQNQRPKLFAQQLQQCLIISTGLVKVLPLQILQKFGQKFKLIFQNLHQNLLLFIDLILNSCNANPKENMNYVLLRKITIKKLRQKDKKERLQQFRQNNEVNILNLKKICKYLLDQQQEQSDTVYHELAMFVLDELSISSNQTASSITKKSSSLQQIIQPNKLYQNLKTHITKVSQREKKFKYVLQPEPQTQSTNLFRPKSQHKNLSPVNSHQKISIPTSQNRFLMNADLSDDPKLPVSTDVTQDNAYKHKILINPIYQQQHKKKDTNQIFTTSRNSTQQNKNQHSIQTQQAQPNHIKPSMRKQPMPQDFLQPIPTSSRLLQQQDKIPKVQHSPRVNIQQDKTNTAVSPVKRQVISTANQQSKRPYVVQQSKVQQPKGVQSNGNMNLYATNGQNKKAHNTQAISSSLHSRHTSHHHAIKSQQVQQNHHPNTNLIQDSSQSNLATANPLSFMSLQQSDISIKPLSSTEMSNSFILQVEDLQSTNQGPNNHNQKQKQMLFEQNNLGAKQKGGANKLSGKNVENKKEQFTVSQEIKGNNNKVVGTTNQKKNVVSQQRVGQNNHKVTSGLNNNKNANTKVVGGNGVRAGQQDVSQKVIKKTVSTNQKTSQNMNATPQSVHQQSAQKRKANIMAGMNQYQKTTKNKDLFQDNDQKNLLKNNPSKKTLVHNTSGKGVGTARGNQQVQNTARGQQQQSQGKAQQQNNTKPVQKSQVTTTQQEAVKQQQNIVRKSQDNFILPETLAFMLSNSVNILDDKNIESTLKTNEQLFSNDNQQELMLNYQSKSDNPSPNISMSKQKRIKKIEKYEEQIITTHDINDSSSNDERLQTAHQNINEISNISYDTQDQLQKYIMKNYRTGAEQSENTSQYDTNQLNIKNSNPNVNLAYDLIEPKVKKNTASQVQVPQATKKHHFNPSVSYPNPIKITEHDEEEVLLIQNTTPQNLMHQLDLMDNQDNVLMDLNNEDFSQQNLLPQENQVNTSQNQNQSDFLQQNKSSSLSDMLNTEQEKIDAEYERLRKSVRIPYLPDDGTQGQKYCLVLDLDETLIHFEMGDEDEGGDGGENADDQGYYMIRPGAGKFLNELSKYYEIVVFTAAMPDYADWILDNIDHNGVIDHRLYRHHTTPNEDYAIKDLNNLGRPLEKTIIIDNLAENFLQTTPNNGIWVQSWYDDMDDNILYLMLPFLKDIVKRRVPDVRKILTQKNKEDILYKCLENGEDIPDIEEFIQNTNNNSSEQEASNTNAGLNNPNSPQKQSNQHIGLNNESTRITS